MSQQIPVFISHTAQDESLLAECERHLAPLDRVINIWHSGHVPPGVERAAETAAQLGRARLVLHLISADYLADDMCSSLAERAMMLEETSAIANVGVIVRACLWRSAMSVPATVLPKDGLPVTSWSNRDEAWTAVATSINSIATLINASTAIMETICANLKESGVSIPEPESVFATATARQFNTAYDPSAHQNPHSHRDDDTHRRRRVDGSGNTEELIEILEDRAATIRRDLQKHYQHIEVQEYLSEFEILHRDHVNSLRAGTIVRAHELARQIHRLSWRLEHDSFWRKQQLEAPSVRYRLRDDAFTRGRMASTYLPGLIVRQSPHSSLSHPTTDDSYLEALRELRTIK